MNKRAKPSNDIRSLKLTTWVKKSKMKSKSKMQIKEKERLAEEERKDKVIYMKSHNEHKDKYVVPERMGSCGWSFGC